MRIALTALVVGVLGLHAPASSRPAPGDRPTLDSILARADGPGQVPVHALAGEIIDLGTVALPKAIDALVSEAARPSGLSSRRAQVVYATCALAGIARWRPIVEARLEASPSPATAGAVLVLVGECGTASEIPLVMRAAVLDAGGAYRAELERSITTILVRDEAGFLSLDSFLSASPDLHGPIARAVSATRKMEAAVLLARWIGGRREMRQLAVPHLSSLALALEKPFTDEVLQPVRILLERGDGEILPDVIICTGRIEDYASIPFLVRWLKEGDAGVRANALWSLRQITGLVLDEDPALWATWLADESRWWEQESAVMFAQMRSGTRHEKVRSLRAISNLHLWREKLAEEVARLLDDEDHELAMYAARSLGRLRSRTAIPALLDALAHPSEPVAQAAHAALEAVTRQALPCDAAGCREALGARP